MALRTSKPKDRKFSFLCECLAAKNAGPKTFSLSILTIQRMESRVTVSAHKTQLEVKQYVTTLHLTTCEVRLDTVLSVPAGLQRKWSSCYREQRRQRESSLDTPHTARRMNAERRTKCPSTFLLHRCLVITIYLYYYYYYYYYY